MKNSKHYTAYYAFFAVFVLFCSLCAFFIYHKNYLKIFVVYYKPAPIIKTNILEPIQAGRLISDTPSRAGVFTPKEISWLKENMIGDETGDNISHLNRYFAEITALYWINSNTSYPYVGMFQYRRYLDINPNHYYPIVEYPSMSFGHLGINHLKGFSKLFIEKLNLEKKHILPILKTHDIIVAEPIKLNTYKQYKQDHIIKDLDLALQIIQQKYPYMYEFAKETLNNDDGFYPSNIFITKKEILNNYSNWLFSILLPVYNQIKTDLKNRSNEQKLALAYLSERLFTIYLRYHKKNHGLKIKELPFVLASDFFLPPINSLYIKLKTPLFEDIFIKHPNYANKICGYNNQYYHCGNFEVLPDNRLKIKWDNKKISYFKHKTDNVFELEN
ncbi:MAG: DUF4422 domain-containing protein [Alphaproteobacteria bacterium]|nr:DUF4422 domain-containing protein [Alphaproteobacteria bacterium]